MPVTSKSETHARRPLRPLHKVAWIVSGRDADVRIDASAATRRVAMLLDLMCDTPTAVNIRLCGLDEMQETNRNFRGKDAPTDVLSFPAAPGASDDPSARRKRVGLGDLLVCPPVCARQAKARRLTLAQELERMIVHGLVHLRGFDHERGDAAWRVMSALEKALLRELQRALGAPEWAYPRLAPGR